VPHLLLDQIGISLLHVSHTCPVLLVLLSKPPLKFLDYECRELESLHLLLEDGVIREELLSLLVICAVWLFEDWVALSRR
jgi:hypothetical protein